MPTPHKAPTVRDTIARHIRAGRTNAEVLAHVRAEHPRAKVSLPTINLYRNGLRKTDPSICTDRQARNRGV
jgi:hypothetical protein